jgi:hypothetical protein
MAAAKLALTKMPMPKGQAPRWRKKYKGKIYYFRGEYRTALAAWERKKVELDTEWEGVKTQLIRIGKGDYAEAIEQHLDDPDSALHRCDDWSGFMAFVAQCGDMTPDEVAREFEDDIECYEEFAAPLTTSEPTTRKITIGQAVDEWNTHRAAQVTMGRVKGATVSSAKLNVSVFRKWVGGQKAVTSIDESMLFDFFAYLAGEIDTGRMKKGYAHQILLYTKAFIRRQWELRRIDLPRNIRSRDLSIRVPVTEIDVLTLGELKAFYNRGDGLLKTCILLSLNCGFNNVDIATLTHNEVDWVRGTITKKRIKTGGYDNVPTVTWKLWPTTLALLREHRSKHAELVLTDRTGRELIRGGGLDRQDTIAKKWRYVRGRLGNKKAYKLLRKTAASLLASHPVYGKYTQYFLAHAPSTVADGHYVKPSQSQFEEAVDWLGVQFGF